MHAKPNIDRRDLHLFAWGNTTTIILIIVTTLWVPLNTHLIHNDYYRANLAEQIKPRALLGTFAQWRHLNAHEFIFIFILQFLKCSWLLLLCYQVFYWFRSRYIGVLLCVLFAFNYAIFSDNVVAGFIDMPANFFILAAACLIVYPPDKPQKKPSAIYLFLSAIIMFTAVLIHEKSLFPIMPLLLWAVIQYKKKSLILILPFALMTGAFLGAVWNQSAAFGLPPSVYTTILINNAVSDKSANVIAIFYGLGMLWLLYFVLGCGAISRQTTTQNKLLYATFFLVSIISNGLPLFMAVDTPRLLNGLWLTIFILAIDQSTYINNLFIGKVGNVIFFLCCLCHMAIPPIYVYFKWGQPINCYADTLFFLVKTSAPGNNLFFIKDAGRQDLHGKLQCWPPTFTRY